MRGIKFVCSSQEMEIFRTPLCLSPHWEVESGDPQPHGGAGRVTGAHLDLCPARASPLRLLRCVTISTNATGMIAAGAEGIEGPRGHRNVPLTYFSKDCPAHRRLCALARLLPCLGSGQVLRSQLTMLPPMYSLYHDEPKYLQKNQTNTDVFPLSTGNALREEPGTGPTPEVASARTVIHNPVQWSGRVSPHFC